MAYSARLKLKAIFLRKQGFSLNEISSRLNTAKSTASEWVSNVPLSSRAKERLLNNQVSGQHKTVAIKRRNKIIQKKILDKEAFEMLRKLTLSKSLIKLSCALLWWCEGNKDNSMLRFTNSDATLVKNFLFLLRSGFNIDESKFRALVHLHKYHDDTTQRKFWSNITKIQLNQFHKSYQKSNGGKRIHENYQGCVAITYYDARIAKELEAIYNMFSKIRGVR